MLLILDIKAEKVVSGNDYAKIKHGIEKMGYVVHYRPSPLYPKQIIIEGAETAEEIFKIFEKECAPA